MAASFKVYRKLIHSCIAPGIYLAVRYAGARPSPAPHTAVEGGWDSPVHRIGLFMLLLSAVFFALEQIRFRSERFSHFVWAVVGPVLRRKENREMHGGVYYCLGVGMTMLFFPQAVSLISLFILSASDTAASFLGIFSTEKQLPFLSRTTVAPKTVGGFLGAALAAVAVTLVWTRWYALLPLRLGLFLAAISGPIAGTGELLNKVLLRTTGMTVDDNIALPLFFAWIWSELLAAMGIDGFLYPAANLRSAWH